MDKQQWRARAAAERAELPVDSEAYCRSVADFLALNIDPGRYVLTFDAMPGEVDLGGLITGCPEPERRYAITRTPDEGFALSIHRFGCTMERHRYGYLQPTSDAPVLADEQIAAVLVPALAFDRSGVRLGRGKGYYDRLLARLITATAAGPSTVDSTDRLVIIGVTGGYIVDSLPHDPFDVPMTHLATETGVYPVPLPAEIASRT